ncbi:heat shock factor-binding protein [Cryptomeria japonica]|uniref:heat shock factor-binding protein n=1 Tax=Cryptomeria japonica TaxID=3369 RepID=UPI0027DA4299|nr:heat shock factor-binding protein [Cryptomeria japonica]
MDRQGRSESEDQREPVQISDDLTAFVKNLLDQMQSRFLTMSESITQKIDEMGTRIDDLEKSIEDLTKETAEVVPPSDSLSPSDQKDTS